MPQTEPGAAAVDRPPAAAPPDAARAYVPAIDGLRAVAVLAVILFHLRPGLLPGGFAGVDLFFVISGFVVTASLARRPAAGLRDRLGHFYARRVARILPALLVMLLVVTVLAAVFVRLVGVHESRQYGIPAFFGLSNIVLARVDNDYFAPGAEFTLFLHTWTLGVEEQFYLLFPFLFHFGMRGRDPAAGRRRTAWIVAAVSAASLVLCALLAASSWRHAFYLMPSRFWELGAGALLYLTLAWWQPRLSALRPPLAAAAAAGAVGALALCFLLLGSRTAWFPFPGSLVPVAAGAGLIALVCARPHSPVARALSHRAAVSVGLLSYSLYLWHWPVFGLFRWTVGLDRAATVAAALAATALLSIASYRLVERPLRRAGGRPGVSRRAVLLTGLLAAAAGAGAATWVLANQRLFASATGHPTYFWGEPFAGCAFDETQRPLSGGTVFQFTPRCPNRSGLRKVVAIGDSHVVSYRKMLTRLAAETGVPVTAYYRSDCPFLGLGRPIRSKVQCLEHQRRAVEELAAALGPGDVLFMPSLRLPHLIDRATGQPIKPPRITPAERAESYAQALATLTRLSRTGARLVLEAPPPVMRTIANRCVDWFNRGNRACAGGYDVPRAELEALRRPVIEAMGRLAREVPRTSVWDPFPILCPQEPCSLFRKDRPLFVDDDHLSGRANDLLYPGFAAAMAGR